MTRKEIIEELKSYFKPCELVSEQVLKRYGEDKIWSFFDTELLHTLLVLRRDILKTPLTINNWKNKGSFSQRGLRANLDPMVQGKTTLYLSGHVLGKAVDFSSSKYTASELRKIIRSHEKELPYPIRLESDKSAPTWVHVDVCRGDDGDDNPIQEFND